MICPWNENSPRPRDMRVNVIRQEDLRRNVSIANNDECWSANLGESLEGSWLRRNLKLPRVLNVDVKVVQSDLPDAFPVDRCLGARPGVYVHLYRVYCSSLAVSDFLRFHLFVKLFPQFVFFRT